MDPQADNLLFVPRKKELQAFRRMLQSRDNANRGLYLRGPGGIGKTWLLRAMLAEAAMQPNVVVVRQLIDKMTCRFDDGSRELIDVEIIPKIGQVWSSQRNYATA